MIYSVTTAVFKDRLRKPAVFYQQDNHQHTHLRSSYFEGRKISDMIIVSQPRPSHPSITPAAITQVNLYYYD